MKRLVERYCWWRSGDQPNERWQADTTHWQLATGVGVEILNVIDDHSRFAIASIARPVFNATDIVTAFDTPFVAPFVAHGPTRSDHASRCPEDGWVASSVATVPIEEHVEDGRMVGHLPVTAMQAGGIRFAIEGTCEGRWRCSAGTFEHLPQVLDETSPVFAAATMNLRVARTVRLGRDGGSRLPVEVSDTGSPLLEAVSHFVVDVRT